jgi:hypothetical protein
MKNKILVFVLLFCLFPLTKIKAQEIANIQETTIKSKILNQKRPILIYTPQDYNDNTLTSYDVIYVFDSQNREEFDLVHSAIGFLNFSKKFIIVGICSPYYQETDYSRPNDYLPKPVNVSFYQLTKNPNSDNFSKYLIDEVFPFINSKYRTTNNNYAIGHSLSASFVLDKFINSTDVFRGYIAISPNFAYDDYRLANEFSKFDNNSLKENKFLYTSQSDEYKTMPEQWNIGYEKYKDNISQKQDSGKLTLINKEFPEENHWGVYLPSLTFGLKNLNTFIQNNPEKPNGEFHTITIKVKTLNKDDEVYIVGNQESLGNWNPSKIKMNYISDFQRTITLKVQFPLEFKITRGDWNSEGATNENDGDNILISKPFKSNVINLKVIQWFDK